jgi:hypothetical protein
MRQYPDLARFIYQAGHIAIAQKNYTQAHDLYEKAAAAGSSGAMNGLGYLYEYGYGVTQSWVEARAWYQTAAAAALGQLICSRPDPSATDECIAPRHSLRGARSMTFQGSAR